MEKITTEWHAAREIFKWESITLLQMQFQQLHEADRPIIDGMACRRGTDRMRRETKPARHSGRYAYQAVLFI